jgi:hypothetical protein
MKEDCSSKSDFVDSRNDTPERISAERISHEDIVLIEKLRAVWMDMSIPKIRLHLSFQSDYLKPDAHIGVEVNAAAGNGTIVCAEEQRQRLIQLREQFLKAPASGQNSE